MITYLLDTNTILHFFRNETIHKKVVEALNLYTLPNIATISIVTVGELRALALKNNWGQKRTRDLLKIIEEYVIIDINTEEVLNNYAFIDAFSQGKLANYPMELSARNMGKNDLWIAACALSINAILLTSDKDFDHLSPSYLSIKNILS